jgi:hypothetical protein
MHGSATFALAALMCGAPLAALAIDSPQLPSSAKKLTGKEIVELQDGVTLTFKDYSADALMTGTTVHDFKAGRNGGTYEYKGIKGTYEGKVWIKDDMFCHNATGMPGDTCIFVYSDGPTFYNVSPEGKVLSIDTKP